MRLRNRRRHNRIVGRAKFPWLLIIVLMSVLCFVAYRLFHYSDSEPETTTECKYSSHNVASLSVKKIKKAFGKQGWCSVKEEGDSLRFVSSGAPEMYLRTFSYELIDDDGCGVARYKDGNNYVLSVPIKDKKAIIPAVSVLSMWNFLKGGERNGDSDNR